MTAPTTTRIAIPDIRALYDIALDAPAHVLLARLSDHSVTGEQLDIVHLDGAAAD